MQRGWPWLILGLLAATGCGQSEPPVGDLASHRERMVKEQLMARGIQDTRVLAAMGKVPREEFVPDDLRRSSYSDHPLPIGHNQTISQPFIVAFMTEKLRPQPKDRILEIGTGSGYQAAILAELAAEVFSIEIVEPLGKRARDTLERLRYKNVSVKIGDGYKGWPEHAPFDSVIVTCAPDHVPQPLVDQLKENGRMIIPVGVGDAQELVLLEKEAGKMRRRSVLPVRFVPMTGEAREKPAGKEKAGAVNPK
jgi:protein-L-isoaspartate(D-aspartate) O-methyltransferase